jgi:CDP-diacylglycerol--glycerol-3-phosphate 3-phosphatidyltransferase
MGRLLLLPVICWLIYPGVETRETSFWAGLLYGLGMILDVVDGAIARRTNAVTVLGQFLDPLADKLFVLVTLVALMQLPDERVPGWIIMVILTREFAVTGLRTLAAAEGIIIAADAGGKLKTLFTSLGTCALIMHYNWYIDFIFFTGTVSCHQVGLILTYISLVLSITSGINYARGFTAAIAAKNAPA